MMYLGVDPGSVSTALAGVNPDGTFAFVRAYRKGAEEDIGAAIASGFPTMLGEFRFAVESQDYRGHRAKGSPQQLITLAHAAGSAFAALRRQPSCLGGEYVAVNTWKGSLPKLIHHRRIMARLGWDYIQVAIKEPYIIPDPAPRDGNNKPIPNPQWRDAIDAIGIALWLRDKHERR